MKINYGSASAICDYIGVLLTSEYVLDRINNLLTPKNCVYAVWHQFCDDLFRKNFDSAGF